MDLVPGPFSAATIASLEALAVANIDNPAAELNARLGVIDGACVICYQAVSTTNEYTTYYFDSSTSDPVNVPYIVAAMTSGKWVACGGKYVNGVQYMAQGLSVTLGLSVTSQGAAIAGGLQVTGITSDASVSTLGGYTSYVVTGTAPFTASSTTVCPNLNVSQLLGATWAAPGTIGSGTPSTGAFTTISATGVITSTLATGTAPFTVASTTVVGNLNVSQLLGSTWAAPGSIGSGTPAAGAFTTLSATGAVSLTTASSGITISKTTTTTVTIASTSAASITNAGGYTSTVATGTAPFTATSTTVCPNLNAALLNGTTWTAPGAIGGGTPSTGAFTTISASGVITSTLATGTAPFTVASTTVVGNLNVSQLLGSTWAIPGSIGATTPAAGAFTTLSSSGGVTISASGLDSTGASVFRTFPVRIGAGTGAPTLSIDGAVANARSLAFRTNGSNRWLLLTDSGAESGSNAGSDLALRAYDDAAAQIGGDIVNVTRAAGGAFAISRPVTLSTASSGLTVSITTGTSLVVSSTAASTTTTSGCATFAGGVGIVGRVNTGGSVAITGTASTNALTVTGVSGQYAAYIVANSTAGNSFGAQILGGTNSSDQALSVASQSGGTSFLTIAGTGNAAATGVWSFSNTTDASAVGTAAVVLTGGLGVAKKIYFGSTLTAAVNSGSTINADLSDTAASRTVAVLRVNTSATAHTTAALLDVVSAASTSSDKMVRVRANSVDLWTVNADGSAAYSGVQSMTNTTDSTSIATGSIVTSGGIGVAKRLTLDGATGKTLRIVNSVANAAVAVLFGGVGPTGSTAGNAQGWMRIDINGTDRYIPFW